MKIRIGLVALAALTGGAIVVAREGQPAAVADFSFTAGAANPSNQFATAAVDLPTGNQAQDPEAEVQGAIVNGFVSGGKPIKDIKIWLEDRDGTPLEGANGGCPVTDFRTSSTTGGSLGDATLAGQSGGVATFNLSNPIPSGSNGSYDMQIGALKSPVPSQFILKMQASYVKADTTKHFDVLGGKSFRSDDNEKYFDVFQRTIRTGSLVELTNSDTTRTISSVRVTLISDNPSVDLVGVHVEDLAGLGISGTSVQFAADGSYFDLSGLNVHNGNGLMLWIDLSAAHERDTAFRVRAIY
jgi:hypothetical protein